MRLRELSRLLERREVSASVPSRIDCGGTLDLLPLALPLERFSPGTVTIATSPRTTATLTAAPPGTVVVDSSAIGRCELPLDSLPLTGSHSLLNAIVHHFGVSGVRLRIESGVPFGSGLGGSGAVAIAAIAAISTALSNDAHDAAISRTQIVHLAHNLENSVQASLTGFSDQLAAAYGGVNLWTWQYSNHRRPYRRRVVRGANGHTWLNTRIAVAFSGESRASASASSQYVEHFLNGRNRSAWLRLCEIAADVANALSAEDGQRAVAALREEMDIRDQICPALWSESAMTLRGAAQRHGCVVRTAGGNRAGCLWAFGEPEAIASVRREWGVAALNAHVASRGLQVHVRNSPL